jgi:hypothetical protein
METMWQPGRSVSRRWEDKRILGQV